MTGGLSDGLRGVLVDGEEIRGVTSSIQLIIREKGDVWNCGRVRFRILLTQNDGDCEDANVKVHESF